MRSRKVEDGTLMAVKVIARDSGEHMVLQYMHRLDGLWGKSVIPYDLVESGSDVIVVMPWGFLVEVVYWRKHPASVRLDIIQRMAEV